MGGVTARNMYSSLQKYNKLYIVSSCWTIIDTDIQATILQGGTIYMADTRPSGS